MRVTIFDYGAGNLHSLAKAIADDGIDLRIETDPARSADTDILVLPGVGAFGHATARLDSARTVMRDAIINGLPTLGICLGMQLLFDNSEEGDGRGLGVIPGSVTRLTSARRPQIGWNSIDAAADGLLTSSALQSAYYANSFVCRPASRAVVRAWSTHESDRFPAMVRQGAVVGVQFHPEKSSAPGVRFIRAFLEGARQ